MSSLSRPCLYKTAVPAFVENVMRIRMQNNRWQHYWYVLQQLTRALHGNDESAMQAWIKSGASKAYDTKLKQYVKIKWVSSSDLIEPAALPTQGAVFQNLFEAELCKRFTCQCKVFGTGKAVVSTSGTTTTPARKRERLMCGLQSGGGTTTSYGFADMGDVPTPCNQALDAIMDMCGCKDVAQLHVLVNRLLVLFLSETVFHHVFVPSYQHLTREPWNALMDEAVQPDQKTVEGLELDYEGDSDLDEEYQSDEYAEEDQKDNEEDDIDVVTGKKVTASSSSSSSSGNNNPTTSTTDLFAKEKAEEAQLEQTAEDIPEHEDKSDDEDSKGEEEEEEEEEEEGDDEEYIPTETEEREQEEIEEAEALKLQQQRQKKKQKTAAAAAATSMDDNDDDEDSDE